MPAWSVPGCHNTSRPRMRSKRQRMSCSVLLSACPMCSEPVTFGGGGPRGGGAAGGGPHRREAEKVFVRGVVERAPQVRRGGDVGGRDHDGVRLGVAPLRPPGEPYPIVI